MKLLSIHQVLTLDRYIVKNVDRLCNRYADLYPKYVSLRKEFDEIVNICTNFDVTDYKLTTVDGWDEMKDQFYRDVKIAYKEKERIAGKLDDIEDKLLTIDSDLSEAYRSVRPW